MADAPPSKPPVYGPRLYELTENDNRGIVLTMAILFMVYTFMVLGMRLATKYKSMGVEDWMSIVATGFAVPQFITVIVATVDAGFGEDYSLIPPDNAGMVARCIRASDVLFLLSLCISKVSVIWFARRLFASGQHTRHLACEVTMGASALWCLGSILGVTVGCDAREVIHINGKTCSSLVSRWAAVGVIDALLELVMTSLGVMVIVPLQMSWKRKLQALTCFTLRLPIIVLIAMNIKYVANFNHASNAGIALISPVLFRQSELFYSLLSAAIPSLNQYLRKFDTRHAAQFGYTPDQYAYSGQAYQLESMSRSKNLTTTSNGIGGDNGPGKADEVLGVSTGFNFSNVGYSRYQTRVEGPANGKSHDGTSNDSQEAESIGRSNSEEHIIRKDVVYEVRRED
ncbi:hypothetical protein ABEF95_009346 [Exophiala dermatitidis]